MVDPGVHGVVACVDNHECVVEVDCGLVSLLGCFIAVVDDFVHDGVDEIAVECHILLSSCS